jgi:DNA-binding NtrC family response regulator
MADTRLLLVDDENAFRRLTARELLHVGYVVDSAATLAEARQLLATNSYQVVLLDLRLPDGSGMDLLTEIKETWPETEVVMLTAFGNVNEAIQAMKTGAFDFLTKPCKMQELEIVLEKAARKRNLERTNTALQREVERLKPREQFIGKSPKVTELLRLIDKVADTDSTVLILGESGVGKEMVASSVHKKSRRSRQPFVVVDCASLHENLLQSELFGHEKGAYTGAIKMKHGLFEVADGGTIFLDEIGELTPPLQVKLLRVIETGTLRRLGSNTDLKVNVRVVAATNRPLEQMMKEGTFREDLFYRLNVFALQIPPLRDRSEDVPLLVEHFVRNSALGARRPVTVSPAAMNALVRYSWPGNVRELENVVERALILCDESVIEPEHLPLSFRTSIPIEEPTTNEGRALTLEEVELRYIKRVLDQCNGHRQKAAQILGISERNLYRRLKGIEADPADSAASHS